MKYNPLTFYRKLAMKILDVQDPDYYEWTTHIFFDDCMEPDDSGYEYQVEQINTMAYYSFFNLVSLTDSLTKHLFDFIGKSICKAFDRHYGHSRKEMVWK